MIWIVIFGSEVSELLILRRNMAAKRHRYLANFYIIILKDKLLPLYKLNLIFQQDNAPIYTAKKITAWFKRNRVK